MAQTQAKENSTCASEQWVSLGKIGRTFGVKGGCHVHSFCRPLENILEYPCFYYKKSEDSQWECLKVRSQRVHQKGFVFEFEGFSSPEAIQSMVHTELFVKREQLPPLGEDAYYWVDLQGLSVINGQKETLGVAGDFYHNGAHDVMVIKRPNSSTLHLPFIFDQVVQQVDLSSGHILVDWDVQLGE